MAQVCRVVQVAIVHNVNLPIQSSPLTPSSPPRTGTPLGDPIEVNALGQALHPAHSSLRAPLTLGSVKSCYGHTEGAAGVTGIFLAAKVLQQHSHPAVLTLRSVNPYVEAALRDWRKRNVAVASVPKEGSAGSIWRPELAAGTSSFGMSGTNAHILLSVPNARHVPNLINIWRQMR